jgi:hypothetical protein
MKVYKLSSMILAMVCYAVVAQAVTIETVHVGDLDSLFLGRIDLSSSSRAFGVLRDCRSFAAKAI